MSAEGTAVTGVTATEPPVSTEAEVVKPEKMEAPVVEAVPDVPTTEVAPVVTAPEAAPVGGVSEPAPVGAVSDAAPVVAVSEPAPVGAASDATPVAAASDATPVAAASDATPETPIPTVNKEAPGANPEPETAEPAAPALVNAQWGAISDSLILFYGRLPEILTAGEHSEVFGVPLVHNPTEPAFSTLLVLQKYLRANEGNVEKAADQLIATLQWRKQMQPVELMAAEHERAAFEGLGYVQVLTSNSEVVTWNIYGGVTDYKKTFGDLDKFIKWRVALMEAAIVKLNLVGGTKPIPDFGQGEDPYQVVQVHDYLNVSVLRMDPDARAASKAAPQVFGSFYPEMLSRKYFVNVPTVMGWLYKATTMFLPAATIKKFRVLSNGGELHLELGEEVPGVYGGKGVDLKDLGDPVKLGNKAEAAPTETPAASAATGDVTTAPDTVA
ncbi:hypothetical protein DRE_03276 [Drechslerella stenobrocha 248]|uniref:Phosphatidylinositol transfer protein SFH5 n=1 Tax=Drechslerella stenobrocha 248 TaxID=1043628 RepID=W7HU08_9PEZI|nr:hypothetical protein DRE_03276 [Drechslerella stenobrocha 248]